MLRHRECRAGIPRLPRDTKASVKLTIGKRLVSTANPASVLFRQPDCACPFLPVLKSIGKTAEWILPRGHCKPRSFCCPVILPNHTPSHFRETNPSAERAQYQTPRANCEPCSCFIFLDLVRPPTTPSFARVCLVFSGIAA